MDLREGQWMPQAGLSICLSDPQQGRISFVSNLLVNTYYLLDSGWMLHTQYLSVTKSDLLIQIHIKEVNGLSRILGPI